MSESNEHRGTAVLPAWRPDSVWFRDFFPEAVPWSDENLLDEVPESARGSWGLRVAETVYLDKERYDPGNIIVVDDHTALRRLLEEVKGVSGLIVPWFDRIVPVSLWTPRTETVELAEYRSRVGKVWTRSLLVTAGLVALGFFQPAFLMIALLGATIYGLFPLVESSMAWFRRVDRFSVDELNRRLVNTELFRIWLLQRSTNLLKIAVGALVLVQVGQWMVDAGPRSGALSPSIEAAALVKERVLEGGEWWRTVTTGLMHGGLLHILFNGMALFSLGRVVAGLANGWLLSFVFLVSVVFGSLASLYFGPAPASVGASGGILGCLGFLLVVCYRFRTQLPSFLG
ncbi:MAG: rhomboid family intramembrane serine protease, partial [Verrucomicrobiota bacterium]